MREKSIEKEIAKIEESGQDLEKLDQTLDTIAEKDKALYEFVENKSEGLEPNAKELIKIFTDISRVTQNEFREEDIMDKKLLVKKAKDFLDIFAQVHQKIKPFFDGIKKFEKFENSFFNFCEQAEAIVKDAESLDENDPKSEDAKIMLNGDIVSVLYKVREVVKGMYEESLLDKNDHEYISLPLAISKKINILAKEK